MKTIGCIGCGNMGGALMRGLGNLDGQKPCLLGVDHHAERIAACGAEACDMQTLGREADLIIVAVKPHGVGEVLDTLFADQTPRSPLPVVLSVAAGVSLTTLRAEVNGYAAVVRCMPNTPVSVGMGAFALCLDDPKLTPEHHETLLSLFNRLGRAVSLPESRFAAFSALMGCGPAYIFYMLESLSEAGVTLGFTRAEAMDMVAYLAAGSAKLAMQPNAHLSLLREAVCSPAGSTIEGIMKLDEHAVKSAMIKAVHAAFAKEQSRER